MTRGASVRAAEQIAKSLLAYSTSAATNQHDAINLPPAHKGWLEDLATAKLLRLEQVVCGPFVADAPKWYYVRPTSPIDPDHPRPLVVENPLVWNGLGAAVGFDNGTAEFLKDEKLWAAIGGLSAVSDLAVDFTGPEILSKPSR
ncbi:MAG: hypothetical protein J0L78_06880 [Planctomycetes bacterium]|nr:hypothetical protein [Planctomycetota bacterium]